MMITHVVVRRAFGASFGVSPRRPLVANPGDKRTHASASD
jgi:hypothetical protein